jgi:hypothetical protein
MKSNLRMDVDAAHIAQTLDVKCFTLAAGELSRLSGSFGVSLPSPGSRQRQVRRASPHSGTMRKIRNAADEPSRRNLTGPIRLPEITLE